jgi:hypothetical protein
LPAPQLPHHPSSLNPSCPVPVPVLRVCCGCVLPPHSHGIPVKLPVQSPVQLPHLQKELHVRISCVLWWADLLVAAKVWH